MTCSFFRLTLALCVAALPSACGDQALPFPPTPPGANSPDASPAAGDSGPTTLPESNHEADASPSDDGSLPESDAGAPRLAPLVVKTTAGGVEGKLVDATRAFLGIPYAEPPVGALRFAAPIPKTSWSGTRNAQEFGALCPQAGDPMVAERRKPGLPRSEDCLTLNVYTPPKPPAAGAPVMVFIHGGAFVAGGAPAYDAEKLSQAGDVVVVTVNYRIGVLAFLAHPELDKAIGTTSGNMALRDQQLALRWVHENIAAFGGDPENVTLFGESAGGISTCIHMFLPTSRGLAQRYIMQSGSCMPGELAPWTRERTVALTQQLIDDLCASQSDAVACLRQVPAETLWRWLGPERKLLKRFVSSDSLIQDWWPHVDGELLADQPLKLLRAGKFDRKPFIVGSNALEFTTFPLFGFPSPTNRLELSFYTLAMAMGYDGTRILTHYMPERDDEANAAWLRMWSDRSFRCATRSLVREAAKQQAEFYYYNFDIAPGAHAQELDYVFGFTDRTVSDLFPDVAPKPLAPDMVDAIQEYWTQFARTGVPSASGQPTWSLYNLDKDENLRLARPIGYQQGLSRDDCSMWNELFGVE